MKLILQKISAVAAVLLLPALVLAQGTSRPFTEGGTGEIGAFGIDLLNFINGILVPFLLAVALALFIYGAFVFLILSGGDEDSRDAGRRYMLWGIIAFVIIVSIWGITELIAAGLGFDTREDIDDIIPNDPIRNP